MVALSDADARRGLLGARMQSAWSSALELHRGLVEAHAQLLFSRSSVTGSLLLGLSLSRPSLALGGCLALAAGRAAAKLLGVDATEWQRGPYAANLLLFGLALASAFAPSAVLALTLSVGAISTVLLVSGLRHLEERWHSLPPLALGYLATHALFDASGKALGFAPTVVAPAAVTTQPGWLEASLSALGSLLFQPSAAAGAVMLLALLAHSRIAALCAALALLLSQAWLRAFGPSEPVIAQCLALNTVLVVVALAAVWFVPSRRSLAVALGVGAVLLVGFSGLARGAHAAGGSLSILPFHLALFAALLALRRRRTHEAPYAVDFLPGTPEQNLAFHSERRARFPAEQAVQLSLPFRGTWTCTQGVDGPHTHQERWRYAWDFEVKDARGSLFEGTGAEREAYWCYRLPALSVAPGTVVAIQDAIVDNAIGELNVAEPFGNHVVVHHAPGVYSLLAHLAPGSIKVRVGEQVERGALLGLVGSSGRSPRPHLHFNLQSSPELGASTLPCAFADVVFVEQARESFSRTRSIDQDMLVRPLSLGVERPELLGLRLGERLTLEMNGRRETLCSSVDLLGRLVLVADSGARLYVELGPSGFVAHDALGPADSVVHLLRACLPRLPYDDATTLHFDDMLRDGWALGSILAWFADFVALFRARVGHPVAFVVRRVSGGVVVEGHSRERRFGRLGVTTRVEVGQRGLLAFELRRGDTRYRAERVFGAPQRSVALADSARPTTQGSLVAD